MSLGYIDRLPEELTLKILRVPIQNLDYEPDNGQEYDSIDAKSLVNMSFTCKRFRDIINHRLLTRHDLINRKIFHRKIIRQIGNRQERLGSNDTLIFSVLRMEHLDFDEEYGDWTQDYHGPNFTRIIELNLYACRFSSYPYFDTLVSKMPSLMHL